KSSESSQPEKSRRVKGGSIRMNAKLRAELEALKSMPDEDINLSDIPEVLDFSGWVVGKFYRPVKKSISMRVDSDVLAWFQSLGGKYQTKMNEALRQYMMSKLK